MTAEQSTNEPSTDEFADQDSSERCSLAPVRNLRRRAIVCGALCAFAMIGSADLLPKLAFCLSMGLLLGSFPQASLQQGAFQRELYVLFLRVQKKRWKLSRFVQLEIDGEEGPFDSFANVFKSGEIMGRIWGVFDACVPWLGGAYKIYFRSAAGKRVLAWQGSDDDQFRANLELLRRTAGLNIAP